VADGGGLVSLTADGIELVQHAASAFEPGLLQIWVRDRSTGRCFPALGAGSGSRVAMRDGALVVDGGVPPAQGAGGIRWRVTFALHPEHPAWAWHVEVVNDGPEPRAMDVVHAHDVALAAPGALRASELYVSQYLDFTPLDGPTGTALAIRQNQAQAGRHPFCVLAADREVVAWATDALDVHGLAGRSPASAATGPTGDLPARRLQHEHTLAALQVAPEVLGPGEALRVTFAGLLLGDHPAATSAADIRLVAEALDLAAGTVPWADGSPPVEDPPIDSGDVIARRAPSGPYDRGRELHVRALTPDELAARWPGPWRLVERSDGASGAVGTPWADRPDRTDEGALLAFFAGDEHVVTHAKETVVLRPHGTILRTGDRAEPDPEGLTATAWMAGSPLSYLARGHATTGRVLTTVRGYLGLHRAYGLRVFVDVAGDWRLLDLPSAFAMTMDSARWVYALDPAEGGGVIEVRTHLPAGEHRADLRVDVAGVPRRLMVALHLATADDPCPLPVGAGPSAEPVPGGAVVRVPSVTGTGDQVLAVRASGPVTVGGDGPLFDDGAARAGGVVTLVTGPLPGFALTLTVGPDDGATGAAAGDTAAGTASVPAADWWTEVTPIRLAGHPEVEALDASLPWLVRDAFVHFLSPRGLEQYTGGAWGTRDVAQGPLELLLALDRLDDARALVVRIFAAQNRDGSWPQAFGFLPGDEDFRLEPPHGDVVHWPVLALGRYLLASGDAVVLDEPVPWYAGDAVAGDAPATALLDHALRALDRARADLLPGTRLVAYGHGDWNDSLQPADPEMTRSLASAWTVTLHHQALRTLADGLDAAGGPAALAEALRDEAATVAADLHRFLLVDGELAGYVQLGEPGGRGTDDAPAGRVAGELPPTPSAPSALRYLVHPRDVETGLRHGSLQIIHALADDLLDPDQAAHHVALVREHLMGVDGVRLFDRPPGYHGGESRHFQRAETATFVGREIGLMYAHAHLRWCEAMARWGDAEALWLGLRQVLAPAVGTVGTVGSVGAVGTLGTVGTGGTGPDVVPGARRRQGNTYASSSDAAVLDRADFAARYADVLTGATGLEAGWRVYSSGPGVLVRIVTQSMLGVRRRGESVELDPVLAARLDGLTAVVPLAGSRLRLRYRVGERGCGVVGVRVGGRSIEGTRTANPYRAGGVSVRLADLADALQPGGPEVEVELS
jgi:CRISPR-associated protein Csx3